MQCQRHFECQLSGIDELTRLGFWQKMKRKLFQNFTKFHKVMSARDRTKFTYHRDCQQATLEPVQGSIVTGQIPKWLEGTLIRNGAGIQTVGSDRYHHFFDGLAILHRFHIHNGKVTYNSRPLESDSYKKNMAAGKIVVSEFGTLGESDPCDSIFSKFKSVFTGGEKQESRDTTTDNCNVNVGYFGDQLYAMTETPFVRRISPETLKTIGGKTNLKNYLPIEQASAHPHILPDGTVITMGTNYRHKGGPHYTFISIPPRFNTDRTVFENSKVVAEIPSRWKLYPGYSHSFSLAGDKVVFVEQPFCFSFPKYILKNFKREPFESLFQWWPNQTTRIHVVSTVDGKPHKIIYETKNLFMFHQVNAYEQDGHIVLDVSAYNDGNLVKAVLGNHNVDCDFRNSLRRYVLPLKIPKDGCAADQNLVKLESSTAQAKLRPGTTNVVDLEPEIILDSLFEFPRINYEFNGKKYRFAYGAASSVTSQQQGPQSLQDPNQISKIDLDRQEVTSWTAGEETLVSEPVFVQNPLLENPAEDDGVLLVSLLHLEDERKVTLVILDAKTMEVVSKVEFKAVGVVSSTLHGKWAQFGHKIHKY